MIKNVWRRLQLQFWFRPALWTVALGALAVLVVAMDSIWIPDDLSQPYTWLLLGNVDGARAMLGAIATAMLTVTTLTFSIFMVAIVQTANAYSPRILNQYISDTANQHVLGIMIGTFVYSLVTLRTVHPIANRENIPLLTVNIALLLSILSVFAFIFFLNHSSHSIKVGNVIRLLLIRAQEKLQSSFPSTMGKAWPVEKPVPIPATAGRSIVAAKGGYVQRFDDEKLMKVATQADLLIRLECRIGDYILEGTTLATVWPEAAVDSQVLARIQQAVQMGTERSPTDDLLLDLRQLSDMAIRALSAGINDPSTAVSCVDALTTLLVQLMPYASVSPYRCDEQGALRVIAPIITFEEMLDEAFDQIREYGTDDVATAKRLLHACGEMALFATSEHRHTIWQLVTDVVESADRLLEDQSSRRRVNQQLEQTARMFPEQSIQHLPT